MISPAHFLTTITLLAATVTAAEPVGEHPLMPILRDAASRYRQLGTEIRDYTCTLVRRERLDGVLMDYEYIIVKIRQQQVVDKRVVVPLSVYLRFLAPAAVQDREVIYVAGRHDGQIIVRNGGQRFAFVTTAISPNGDLAMKGNRYPITEIGIKNLIKRLVEVGQQDLKYGECEVHRYENVKLSGRSCTVMEIVHPTPRRHFRYHKARIFIDDELQLPIRYSAYDWPAEAGADMPLTEEYTYLDLKLNVGLTDLDFDHRNPAYGFRKDFTP